VHDETSSGRIDAAAVDAVRVFHVRDHLADRQRLAAPPRRELRPVEQRDDEDDVGEARPDGGGDRERDQHAGQRQRQVGDAHDRIVDATAGHRRDDAEQHADQHRRGHRADADDERDAAAVDHAAQHVAAERVGAHQVGGDRRRQQVGEVLLVRVVGRHHVGEQRGADHQHEERGRQPLRDGREAAHRRFWKLMRGSSQT